MLVLGTGVASPGNGSSRSISIREMMQKAVLAARAKSTMKLLYPRFIGLLIQRLARQPRRPLQQLWLLLRPPIPHQQVGSDNGSDLKILFENCSFTLRYSSFVSGGKSACHASACMNNA